MSIRFVLLRLKRCKNRISPVKASAQRNADWKKDKLDRLDKIADMIKKDASSFQ